MKLNTKLFDLTKWNTEMNPLERLALKLFNKSKAGYGAIKLTVEVAVVDKVSGERSQVKKKVCDVGTVQFMNLIAANVFASAQTSVCKDTGATATRSVPANSACTTIQVVAGTAGTTAAVTDYMLTTQSASTQGAQTAVIGTVNTSTGVMLITANMAAPGSTIVYKEIGIYLTANAFIFCVARDYNGSGWSVDTSHYLAVTYTLTPS
jgi:hypothetical protein